MRLLSVQWTHDTAIRLPTDAAARWALQGARLLAVMQAHKMYS
jgi:hypothetical protein